MLIAFKNSATLVKNYPVNSPLHIHQTFALPKEAIHNAIKSLNRAQSLGDACLPQTGPEEKSLYRLICQVILLLPIDPEAALHGYRRTTG